jgi:hypothetical protein
MKCLLGLVLCLFLIPMARADGANDFRQPNSVYLVGLDVNGPVLVFGGLDVGAGRFFDDAFGLALPLEGGIMGYGFSEQLGPDDSRAGDIGSLVPGHVNAFGGCSGRGSVVQFPPGFVEDPNVAPIDQYPFDLCFSPLDVFVSDPHLFKKVSANDFTFVPGTYAGGELVVTGASVPEPATLTFLLTGFGALALRKRRPPR